jgi:uncharacterized protein (UPF0332 family)
MSPELRQLVAYRMERAWEAFHDAEALSARGSTNSAANRLYYAAFYAVSALLLANNLGASKHSGVRALFNQHFVKTDKVSPAFATLYNKLFAERTDADYADMKVVAPEFVRDNLPQVEEFIGRIAVILQASGYTEIPQNTEQDGQDGQ